MPRCRVGAAMNASTQFTPTSASAQPPSPRTSPASPLVRRLIQPDADSGRRRIRHLLLQLPDERLRSGLGLSDADIAVLRSSCWDSAARVRTAAAVPTVGPRLPPVEARPPWRDTCDAIVGV